MHNSGNILFQECTKSKIYVDKTGLIEYTNEWLNTENKFVCAIENEEFASYRTATGTYESVKKGIDMNFDGLALLVHLGYLGYDSEKRKFIAAVQQLLFPHSFNGIKTEHIDFYMP